MAYPSIVVTGDCPSGPETPLVSLFYETVWNTYAFKDRDGQFAIPAPPPSTEFLWRHHPQMRDTAKRDVEALNVVEVVRRPAAVGDSSNTASFGLLLKLLISFQMRQMLVRPDLKPEIVSAERTDALSPPATGCKATQPDHRPRSMNQKYSCLIPRKLRIMGGRAGSSSR